MLSNLVFNVSTRCLNLFASHLNIFLLSVLRVRVM